MSGQAVEAGQPMVLKQGARVASVFRPETHQVGLSVPCSPDKILEAPALVEGIAYLCKDCGWRGWRVEDMESVPVSIACLRSTCPFCRRQSPFQSAASWSTLSSLRCRLAVESSRKGPGRGESNRVMMGCDVMLRGNEDELVGSEDGWWLDDLRCELVYIQWAGVRRAGEGG